MLLLLLAAAALAQPEELLQRGTTAYNAGDAAQAHRAFVQLSNDMEAPPHLRAQAHQGLAALAQRRGDASEAMAHVDQAVTTCDAGTCDAQLRATFYEARGVLKRGAGDVAPSTHLHNVLHWTRIERATRPWLDYSTTMGIYKMHLHVIYAPSRPPRLQRAVGARAACSECLC
jgi:hypothetical protein